MEWFSGEGLGNKFLAHIRETDATLNVVRCFEDDNVIHVAGKVDPISDIEVIQTELCLADMAAVEKALHRVTKTARSGDKESIKLVAILEKCQAALNEAKPVRTIDWGKEELPLLQQFFLITAKPAMFVANVAEDGFENNPFLDRLKAFAALQNAPVVAISAKMEAEMAEMEDEDRTMFLAELGQTEPGLNRLIRAAFKLLGLQTYFTAGDNTLQAIRIFNKECGIAMRHITLSTVGIVPNIDKLANENLQLTLAVSLHAPNDILRTKLVPVAAKYPMEMLMASCRRYAAHTHRRLTFEYVLLKGVNDRPEDARELGMLIAGMPAALNIIPYNPTAVFEPFERPDPARIAAFRRIVEAAGVTVTQRKERGQQIAAACGQLVTESVRQTPGKRILAMLPEAA